MKLSSSALAIILVGVPASTHAETATTTRYWDCSGGACGCSYLPPFLGGNHGAPSHCYSNAMFAAPSGNEFGASFYGAAAISQALGGGDWLAEGCGKCWKLTGKANIAGTDTTTVTTLVLKGTNYCPPTNAACSGGKKHFDIAAPGFDYAGATLSNTCSYVEPDEKEAFGSCGYWMINSQNPDENCDCNAFSNPVLRDGCFNFKSLSWNNPTVEFDEVNCPPELAQLPCWEENGGTYAWPDAPDLCMDPLAGSSPTNPSPTNPSPTNPSPTNPAPTNPAPTNPAPTNPAPTNPAPTNPAPTNPAPTPSGGGNEPCCTYNFNGCEGGPWCNESQSNCEGGCNGFWYSLPFVLGDHCCSWNPPNCVNDNYNNGAQRNCEASGGQWIARTGAPAPTNPPPTNPAPTNPAPTNPAPTNPAPTNPAPTNPAPTNPAPTNPAPTPTTPVVGEIGELTWWTGDTPGPLSGSSCNYATADATKQSDSWLEPYVYPKMYCAVSEDLFANGVGCGKCFRLYYDGVGGTDPATAGSADIQVVNSGAGGSKHFDCFEDAFRALTGISTGIFPVSYTQIDCTDSPLTAVVLDGWNAYYVKTLIAGGKTGVVAVDITVGGTTKAMSKVVGATWSANLSGVKDNNGQDYVRVKYDITFADGSTAILDHCHGGSWPVATGAACD